MSDEQVKGIPEDLQSLYRLATLYPNDRYAYERTNNEVAALIERCSKSEAEHAREVMQHAVTKFKLARSEQVLAALEARNKKAEALLLRWNKAAGWYCAGSEFVDDPERVFESIKSRMEMREKLGQRKAETAARAALKGAS